MTKHGGFLLPWWYGDIFREICYYYLMESQQPRGKKRTVWFILAMLAVAVLVFAAIGWYRGFPGRTVNEWIEYGATVTPLDVVATTPDAPGPVPASAASGTLPTVSPPTPRPSAKTSALAPTPAPAAPASAPSPDTPQSPSGAVVRDERLGFEMQPPAAADFEHELLLNRYECVICNEVSFDAFANAHASTLSGTSGRIRRTTATGETMYIFTGTIPNTNLDTGATTREPWQEIIVELPPARRVFYRAIRVTGNNPTLGSSSLDALARSIRVTAREPLAADRTPPYPDFQGGPTEWSVYRNPAYQFSFARPTKLLPLQYRMTPAAPFEIGFGGSEFTIIATVFAQATADEALRNNPDCGVGELTPVSYQDAGGLSAGAGAYPARHYAATPTAKTRCDFYIFERNGAVYTLEFPVSWETNDAKKQILSAIARVVATMTLP